VNTYTLKAGEQYMEALRLIKTLKTMEVEELAPFVGQKIEIIVFPLIEESDVVEERNLETDRQRFFTLIDQHSGTIRPWTREELYER
jgi:hypothetical protein